jgi:Tol biopolymer transport system component
MSVTTGARIGAYEVLAPIGRGGMGEVYRARDTRLGRDVAIKILPASFTSDPDRLARFTREAQVLASLNHPNIAAIYHVEDTADGPAIVMELVEGETLAERISRGPIPIDEALPIARQIAEALEAAHEQGVIHRDLKPANIKITSNGQVKVLDFGLAKLADTGTSSSQAHGSPLPSLSPTITSPALMTGIGVLLGTAAYMSPEQAKGRPADKRSDIWAFGCVLFEMLTARRAFAGDDVSDTLASVLKAEPDWTALAQETPPPIRRLLRRCLAKDSKARIGDAAIARIEIDDLESGAHIDTNIAQQMPRRRERLGWVAAGVLLLVGAVSAPFAVVHFREPARDDRPIRFVMLAPEKATVSNIPPIISPDGRRLAFVATVDGKTQLWIRPIDSTTAQPLPGTDNADYPFWSPDNRFIAFFSDGKLRKIDASGGPPQTLCDAPAGRGGAWNGDGVIFFAASAPGPLYRVSSSGGTATQLTTLDSSNGEINHRSPSFLPDGRHFVFFVQGGEDKQGIYLGSLETKERRLFLAGNSTGAYAWPGYLLFVKEQTLMAQPLDVQNLELAGEAVPIAEPVGFYNAFTATFSVSDNGVLAHANILGAQRQLAWFDRTGKLVERIGSPIPLYDVALSPDEKRAAIQWAANDIRVVDLVRSGVPLRLTFNPTVEDYPVWSPDGSRVLFNSTEGGGQDIYWKASTGAGSEEVVLKSGTPKRPTDWSRDGRFILYENDDPKSRIDLWVLPLFGDRKPELFLRTPFIEQHGRFSPDGKWIAYVSDESGTLEVYVQSFPPSGGKWQVSTKGGITPRWRRDGKELFYLSPDRRIMSVDVRASGTTFELSTATVLFEAPVDSATTATANRYDVSADGQRFLVNAPVENAGPAPITVVVNWTAGLKK